VLISQIYSWNEKLHVSDSSSVHHQEFFTAHTCKQEEDGTALQFHPDPACKLSANLILLAGCQQT
jgi:hypothetical protein